MTAADLRRRRLRAGRRPGRHRADVQPAGLDRGGQRERVELPAHVRPARAQHGGDHGAAPGEEARRAAQGAGAARRCRRPSRSRFAATGVGFEVRDAVTDAPIAHRPARRDHLRQLGGHRHARPGGAAAQRLQPAVRREPRSTCSSRWTTRTCGTSPSRSTTTAARSTRRRRRPSAAFTTGGYSFRGGASGPHNGTSTGGIPIDVSGDPACAYSVNLGWVTRRYLDTRQTLQRLYCH